MAICQPMKVAETIHGQIPRITILDLAQRSATDEKCMNHACSRTGLVDRRTCFASSALISHVVSFTAGGRVGGHEKWMIVGGS